MNAIVKNGNDEQLEVDRFRCRRKKNITTSAATAAGRRLLAKVAVDRSEACGMRIGSHADSGPQLSKNLFTICAAGAALAWCWEQIPKCCQLPKFLDFILFDFVLFEFLFFSFLFIFLLFMYFLFICIFWDFFYSRTNKCSGVDRISPARKQVLPHSERLHKFHRRQTDEQTNRQTDRQT